MPESLINSLLIAGFTVLLGTFVAWVVRVNTQHRAEIKDLQDSMNELKASMGVVNTQMSPLWARVQAQIAQDLHHPSPRYAEMDKLLEKLEALTITVDERAALKALLIERSKDTHED